MYCSTPKDPFSGKELFFVEEESSKWATLGILLEVNGLALVDAGISTLFSELLNGVPESLDFRLLYFWLVEDIAAPELGLDHIAGVDLVAIKVGFPDGI
jgi:hypothetical protein